MKKSIVLLCVLLVVGIVFMGFKLNLEKDYTYIITETGASNSFDPLDADQTNNLPVARMIYSTPFEVDQMGNLNSSILDQYQYDENNYTMNWVVKSGLRYSDGSELTANDVAFAVARMTYARPSFPVIEDIQGVSEWLKEKRPLETLPSGIRLSGNKIEIQFNKKQDHPLFRFCLEIFSIIPKLCVDSSTNKIKCVSIPSSGYYQVVEKTDKEIVFKKRDFDKIFNLNVPTLITFKYLSNTEAIEYSKNMNERSLIAGNELRYLEDELAQLKISSEVVYAPASRIVAFVLNPHVEPFKSVKNRQIFVQAFRNAFKKTFGDRHQLEASIFTDLLPGYLSQDDLYKSISENISLDDIVEFKSKVQGASIQWSIVPSNPQSTFSLTMESVFKKLGIADIRPLTGESGAKDHELFVKGKLSIVGLQTGFWAFDPAGDIQMLMTPNMHKALKFVSEDKKMQQLIKNLKASGLNESSFTELNKHIFKESLFNVFTHGRRFIAVKDRNKFQEGPLSITSPAPWQYFKME